MKSDEYRNIKEPPQFKSCAVTLCYVYNATYLRS